MTAFTTVVDNVTDNLATYHNELVNALTLNEYAAAVPGGRLTLTSGTPVTTSDVTGATSVYYTPCTHDRIMLWNGTAWQYYTFTEKTLALGTVTSALPYDVFGYVSAGALVLEKLAWTSATARATAITLQDGRYAKSGDKTRLYLGTFYTTSTTTTEDSGGGTSSAVGGKRFLWNMYNRVSRPLAVIDTTDNWSYATDTIRQANAAAGNKVEFVLGLSQNEVFATVMGIANLVSNTTRGAKVGVGVDSTTAFSGIVQQAFNDGAASLFFALSGQYRGFPAVGYHYLAWCEKGATAGTCAFHGDSSGASSQSGLIATVMG